MLKSNKEKILHDLFKIGIIIKGIDGFFELLGGIILIVTRGKFASIIQILFSHELSQDPTDFIANYFVHLSGTLSLGTIFFISFYLIIHGAIKLGLFFGLWFKKLWTYPLAWVLLSLFVIYQLFRFSYTYSIFLLFLTIVDFIIIVLLHFEYKRIKLSLKINS